MSNTEDKKHIHVSLSKSDHDRFRAAVGVRGDISYIIRIFVRLYTELKETKDRGGDIKPVVQKIIQFLTENKYIF